MKIVPCEKDFIPRADRFIPTNDTKRHFGKPRVNRGNHTRAFPSNSMKYMSSLATCKGNRK